MAERKESRAAERSDGLADIGSFMVVRVRRRTTAPDACGAFTLIFSWQVGPGSWRAAGDSIDECACQFVPTKIG